ncbi:MAG: translation initiation factor IF-3 [Victivallaceae bacterium]
MAGVGLRTNKQIRAQKVRLINADGEQVGVVGIREATDIAKEAGLDLVEIAPNVEPPVCKIMDYGKYRYDATKREKDNKKAQHQIRVKEVKLKPNIDEHDFLTKLKQAKHFLEKGNKVKITCTFRGREMAYPEHGHKVVSRMSESLEDLGSVEAEPKLLGRSLICILAPGIIKIKKKQEKSDAKNEEQ